MPLTAAHPDAGLLDLTADPYETAGNDAGLADGIVWADIYRARPRAPLTCRECGHGLHAKVSRNGLRFFAHDAGAPNCGLAGESMSHRLLKLELATAIRAAGWHAELEAPGNGWRADVLAISPDGSTRMAWEAQLAAATSDELTERTERMNAEGVTVCWVTDKDRPFIGHVPSIRIQADEPPNDAEPSEDGGDVIGRPPPQLVIDGLGAFMHSWCDTRPACSIMAQHGLYGRDEGPCCPCHGQWVRPRTRMTLSEFVTHVLAGTVRLHTAHAEPPWELGRHRPGRFVWTTRRHWLAEQEEVAAEAVAAEWRAKADARFAARRERELERLRAVAALEARQKALTPPAVELVGREARGYVGVRDPSPHWAMGVPLFVHDMPEGVISPVASRIDAAVRERLRSLPVFVATPDERDRLARVCAPGQRIVMFEVEVVMPAVDPTAGMTKREVLDVMFRHRFR